MYKRWHQGLNQQEQSETAWYARLPASVNALLVNYDPGEEHEIGHRDPILLKRELNILST